MRVRNAASAATNVALGTGVRTVYAAALPAAGSRSAAARALLAHYAKLESQPLFTAAGVHAAPRAGAAAAPPSGPAA